MKPGNPCVRGPIFGVCGGSGSRFGEEAEPGVCSNHVFSARCARSCLCPGICLMCTVIRVWPRQPSLSATPVQLSCPISNGRSLVRNRVLALCHHPLPQGKPHFYQVWRSGLVLGEEGLNSGCLPPLAIWPMVLLSVHFLFSWV